MTGASSGARASDLAGLLHRCEICEHRCGVDRRVERGVCGLGTDAFAYRVFLHHGEEAEIAPTVAVFVTGCSLRCAFCSDAPQVERPESGSLVVPRELARAVDGLASGARSVSFVGGNPDESMVPLLEAVEELRCGLPVVWNSNLYLAPGPLEEVIRRADVFVADLKFGNDACARVVARATGYGAVLARNLAAVHGRRRLIVRHLLMPGHAECCAEPVVRHVARVLPEATLNLMTQYEPRFATWPLSPALRRRPSAAELARVRGALLASGLASVWWDGRPEGSAPPPVAPVAEVGGAAGTPFESRVVVRGDGSVVVEHAGEGLEALRELLSAPGRGAGGASGAGAAVSSGPTPGVYVESPPSRGAEPSTSRAAVLRAPTRHDH